MLSTKGLYTRINEENKPAAGSEGVTGAAAPVHSPPPMTWRGKGVG